MLPGCGLSGNSNVVEFLRRVGRSGSLGHAYLFTGPDGVGKKMAALEFARVVNCSCLGEGVCDSCRAMDTLQHPELLLLADANKPRWLGADRIRQQLGLTGEGWKEKYRELLEALLEKEYLEPPLPGVENGAAVHGFTLVTDHLFGKGSVPSRDCYTPSRVSETIRKSYEQGGLPEPEYRILKLLYEYPLSMMPYRGALPIAYITERQGWQFTRPVQSFLARRSLLGGRKVVIIDDAHNMTPEAQNCLLKTLEEPPNDSLMVLVTSAAERLFPTILSRCQVVRFKRLTSEEMESAMSRLLGDNGERSGTTAALAGNCPGRALELSLSGVEGKLDAVRGLIDHLAAGRPEQVFAFSRSVLGEGTAHRRKLRAEVRATLELVVFWLLEVMRHKAGLRVSRLPESYGVSLRGHAGAFSETQLLAMTRQIEEASGMLSYNVDLGLLLDATLLKLGVGS